jgi:O-antigen biosynthesis protein WbqV
MNARLGRHLRAGLVLAHDGAMAAASFYASLALRLGGDPLQYSRELVVVGTAVFTVVAVAVFGAMRLHRGVWRYTSLPEVLQILRAVTLAILLFLLLLFWITRLEDLPRSALAINWLVLAALLAGPRIGYRLARDRGIGGVFARPDADRIPVLLVGAGDGAELFLRALSGDPDARYRAVGIVDDAGGEVGRRIRGVEVLGTVDGLDAVMERLAREGRRPRRLIVTEESFSGPPMAALLEQAGTLGVNLARLPRMTDFRAADGARLEPRPVAIDDLLGRPQQVLDRAAMEALVCGRRVLVTGAGGTIGGELARQIASLAPAHLALLDNTEYALYAIDLETAERAPGLSREAILGDVRERERIAAHIRRIAPDLVFHAAALKHVPIVEAHPEEGVLTNAVGSRNVADACRASGVGAMVLVSTDKAVNPASVMGASKRVAESYCQAMNLARAGEEDTRFITVRFGNVLGSTGSVVPLFQRQLAQGGPLTVTHPDVTRYFMTVREAVELVLEATALGAGGQGDAAIFVLDMGAPVRIIDLARQMIRLAGLRPEVDIPIAITGLRPGEKLTEELFHKAEATEPTRYPGVLIARPRPPDLATLADGLAEIEAAARAHDRARVTAALARLVPEYAAAGAAPRRRAVP